MSHHNSRYRGARQFWVPRPQGGMIDVLHFPASSSSSPPKTTRTTNPSKTRRAVLYCNPNAGLIEVATGLALVGGNVPAAQGSDTTAPMDTWVDFYTKLGFDVYLFNYAGYGRSHGTACCCPLSSIIRGRDTTSSNEEHPTNLLSRLRRIVYSSGFAFQPRPDTLKSDGIAVAEFILNPPQQEQQEQAVLEQLVIHGESIGGMTASGVARHLTTTTTTGTTRRPSVLLVCDRTFCNLEAVAQRLVGSWTAPAIRSLTLFVWNTDVAGDYLAASCPKIVAQDAADAIIADEASLKTGIAIWKETCASTGATSTTTTNGVGWIRETPLRYRMAEFENSSVSDTSYCSQSRRLGGIGDGCGGPSVVVNVTAPIWPTDKHVRLEEAFHFAACCKRIGKLATALKRKTMPPTIPALGEGGGTAASDEGLDSDSSLSVASCSTGNNSLLLMQVWRYLATCDGLVGFPLGAAVKRGLDSTVAWLCATLVYGGQMLVLAAEKRMAAHSSSGGVLVVQPAGGVSIEACDFGPRTSSNNNNMGGEEGNENTAKQPQSPTPIPEVVERIERILVDNSGDTNLEQGKVLCWWRFWFGFNYHACNICLGSRSRRFLLSNSCCFLGFTLYMPPMTPLLPPVRHEVQFVMNVLRYIQTRLSSKAATEVALQEMAMTKPTENMSVPMNNNGSSSSNNNNSIGCLIRLQCGHNAPFSSNEKAQLKELVQRATTAAAAAVTTTTTTQLANTAEGSMGIMQVV